MRAVRREKRHPLDNLGPADARQIRCAICRKIVMVGRTRDELLPPFVLHLEAKHAGVVLPLNVFIVEGDNGHFIIEKPPHRCDLCGVGAELPWWTYYTPRTADYQVQDEGWLVCDACQPLVEADDLMGLVRRAVQIGAAEYVTEPARIREHAINVMPSFLHHVDKSRTTRDTIGGT